MCYLSMDSDYNNFGMFGRRLNASGSCLIGLKREAYYDKIVTDFCRFIFHNRTLESIHSI